MSNVVELSDYTTEWLVGKESCRACGHNAIGVMPVEADLDRLECVKCGQMEAFVTHVADDEAVWHKRLADVITFPGRSSQ